MRKKHLKVLPILFFILCALAACDTASKRHFREATLNNHSQKTSVNLSLKKVAKADKLGFTEFNCKDSFIAPDKIATGRQLVTSHLLTQDELIRSRCFQRKHDSPCSGLIYLSATADHENPQKLLLLMWSSNAPFYKAQDNRCEAQIDELNDSLVTSLIE